MRFSKLVMAVSPLEIVPDTFISDGILGLPYSQCNVLALKGRFIRNYCLSKLTSTNANASEHYKSKTK